jgi:hypothetical protein
MESSPNVMSGMTASISDTALTTDRYNLAIAEVLPAGGGGAPPPPPVVTMTSPAPNATVASKTTVAANATDQGAAIASVRFLVDGNNLGTQVSTAPYTLTWDTSTATAGVQRSRRLPIAQQDRARRLAPYL